MADGEQQQLVQSQEGSEQKSYGTEATGVRGEEDEPKLLKEEPPENGLNQNIKPEEGSKSLTAAETDDNTAQPSLGAKDGEQEGSAIDPAKTASDHDEEETVVEIETQARNGGAVSDEAAATATKDEANLDKEIDQDRRPEQSPKEESGKTPPPEKPEPEPVVVKEELQSPKEENGKVEEPEMVKEGLQSPKEESGKPPPPGEPELEVHVIKEEPQGRSQTPPPPAEKAAPKQKEGGGGGGLGFFSQLRRGFSTGPKRGKEREVTIIHLFCCTTHTYQIASTMKVFHWRRRERSTHVAGTSSLWTRLKRGKSLESSDVSYPDASTCTKLVTMHYILSLSLSPFLYSGFKAGAITI